MVDAVLVGVVIVMTAATAVYVAVPDLRLWVVAPALDLVLHTLAAVVIIGVVVLAWVRYRQRGEPVALFQAAAFLVLAVSSCVTLAFATGGLDTLTGAELLDAGPVRLYTFTFARPLAGGLLVVGAIGSLRSQRVEHAVAIVFGAAGTMLLVAALIQVQAAHLPSLGPHAVLAPHLGAAATSLLPAPLAAAIQVLAAALFLCASALSRRVYARDGSMVDGYLAVALVFAAFAQVQALLYPGNYLGVITASDLLQVAFDITLLLGIHAETSTTLVRLRRANGDLERLAEVESAHAALAERARLARELHDGLMQDLWLAKLKTGRLAATDSLAPEAAVLTDELRTAIDAGLVEAQQAVAAMRLAGEPTGTLRELLSRSVDEFADRFGLRIEFDCLPDLPPLPPRAQAEALRITQEALNNVRRHADATVVRVRAGVEDGLFHLVVGDNGRGFIPDSVGDGAFGLASMRERAALVGGELRIDSRPQDGTRVSLYVPLAATAPPSRPCAS